MIVTIRINDGKEPECQINGKPCTLAEALEAGRQADRANGVIRTPEFERFITSFHKSEIDLSNLPPPSLAGCDAWHIQRTVDLPGGTLDSLHPGTVFVMDESAPIDRPIWESLQKDCGERSQTASVGAETPGTVPQGDR